MPNGSFLDRLSPADRQAVESVAIRRAYRKGAIMFLEGDEASEVLLIHSGQIKITIGSQDGREVLLEVRGAGEVVGEMALIDNSPRSASAFVLTPTEVLVLPVREFLRMVDEQFGFTRALLDELCRKVRDSTYHQLELGLDNVSGRVNRRVADLCTRFGVPQPDGTISFKSPITQQELADWSGVSRQAVVKEFARMRELGWIETRGSTITVKNRDAIFERAAVLSGIA